MRLVEILEQGFRQAVTAVDPRRAMAEAAARADLQPDRVLVAALGKAAAGMAWGLADVLGPLRGLVVTDEARPLPSGLRSLVGGHPVPSAASLAAGEALLAEAAAAGPDATLVVLVSGGGSALAEALVPGVSLGDLRALTEELLRSGAPIEDVNVVRRALSHLKGGGLAAAAAGATVVTFAISDVVGDRPDVIASGPTVVGDGGDARGVLERWGLTTRVPQAVIDALSRSGRLAKRDGAAYTIVASGERAAQAAAVAVRRAGLEVAVVDTALAGAAAVKARRVLSTRPRAAVEIYAGETTVTVTGSGTGGRNHEAALAAAIALDGRPDTAFLAAGTDGIDGSTPGAGAVVDGGTAAEGRELGLQAADYLADNDSGGFFDRVPGRITTGRTGTNVGDLWMVAHPTRPR